MTTNQKKSGSESIGCLVLIGFGIWLAYVGWGATTGCLLADQYNYVTNACAVSLLQKPGCNEEMDIIDVDEVKDISYVDDKGNRHEVRSVIYKFRKRPTVGPVSDAIMRDTMTLYKQGDHWVATCANVSPATSSGTP